MYRFHRSKPFKLIQIKLQLLVTEAGPVAGEQSSLKSSSRNGTYRHIQPAAPESTFRPPTLVLIILQQVDEKMLVDGAQ